MTEPMRRYVYVSIGNSDDKLTQQEWSDFYADVHAVLRVNHLHGAWVSQAHERWQNACWCFDIHDDRVYAVKRTLAALCLRYKQRAIAWAEAEYNEITPHAF